MSVVCVARVATVFTHVAKFLEVNKAPRNSTKPGSLLHGGNINQDGKEVYRVEWVMTLMMMRMRSIQMELAVSEGEIR